jgi:small nuclear ribonucleoprotein (snRNP)-like protein
MKRLWFLAVFGLTVSGSVATAATGMSLWHTFGSGTYRVPRDVPPGTYRSRGGDGCYWARLRSFSGSLNAIIANDIAVGPTLVTIKRTDKGFETHSCARWTNNLARITKSKTRFGSGTFIVRVDIAPGTYKSRGGSSCYWARLRSFTGTLSAIISNNVGASRNIVTIQRSDRGFQSHGCGTWTRF